MKKEIIKISIILVLTEILTFPFLLNAQEFDSEVDTSFKLLSMSNIATAPHIDNGIIYYGSWRTTFGNYEQGDGHIYAVDLTTKKELWRYKCLYEVGSTPVTSEGMIYFGNGELVSYRDIRERKGCFYALDCKTGKEKWRVNTGGGINCKPSILGDIVYFGCHDGYLYALNKKTGEEIWKFQTYAPVVSSPVIYENTIYLGTKNAYLYAIDVLSGKMIWKSKIELDKQSALMTPAVSDKRIFVARHAGLMHALDRMTGDHLWTYPSVSSTNLPDDGFIHSPPSYFHNKVFFASHDFFFYVLEEEGNLRWKKMLDERGTQNAIPYIDDSSVYLVNLDGYDLYSIDINRGETNWKFESTGSIFSTPIANENLIFINSLNGNLFVINKQTGKLEWAFSP